MGHVSDEQDVTQSLFFFFKKKSIFGLNSSFFGGGFQGHSPNQEQKGTVCSIIYPSELT